MKRAILVNGHRGPTPIFWTLPHFPLLILLALAWAIPATAQAQTSLGAFEFREGHREAAMARRARAMDKPISSP